MSYINFDAVRQLQEVELDDRLGWRPLQAPVDGFRLKMNLQHIRRAGYSNAVDLSSDTIRSYGYTGAIRMNDDGVTYLYR